MEKNEREQKKERKTEALSTRAKARKSKPRSGCGAEKRKESRGEEERQRRRGEGEEAGVGGVLFYSRLGSGKAIRNSTWISRQGRKMRPSVIGRTNLYYIRKGNRA